MSFDSEYQELRKKRKKEMEQKAAKLSKNKATNKATNKPYAQKLISSQEIAPVLKKYTPPTTTVAPTVTTSKKKKEDDRTWFKKGSGGVVSSILGTAADIGEDIGTGIIGMGEKAVDFFTMVGTSMSNAQMSQLSNDELAFSAVKNIGKDKKTKEKEAENIVKKYTTAQKDAKKGTTDFVKKDLYDEEKIAKKIISAPVKKYTGIDVEASSVLGEKSDALIQSAGQLLATAGLQALGVPWFLTTGATSFGAEAENALNQGATFEQATMSAAVSAGAEILTEKLSGGIKFGGKTLDDVLVKPLTEKISNKVLKTLANLGIDALGEGGEEVISGIFSNLGTALYKEESIGELLTSEEAVDEYIESFIGGAFLGGVSSGIGAVANRNRIELSENELSKEARTVFDKVVEERIAEATEDGKTLTEIEEAKIRQAVLNEIDNGAIDTEKIESILDPEEYEKYKRLVDASAAYETNLNDGIEQMQARYDELQKEYDELNELDLMKAKLGDHNRQNDIKNEMSSLEEKIQQWNADLDKFKNDKNRSELESNLKTKLSQNVFDLVKDSRLAESYRVKQKFEADFEKFKGTKHEDAARKSLENAVKAGVTNSKGMRTLMESNARFSANTGVVFEYTTNEKEIQAFTENQTKEIEEIEKIPEEQRTEEQNELLAEMKDTLEKVQRGDLVVDGTEKPGVITVNLDSPKALNVTTGHEISHLLEKAKHYKKAQEALFKYASMKGVNIEEELTKRAKKYKGIKNGKAEAELFADLVGGYLYTDYDFVVHLANNNQSVFHSLWDSVKYLYKMATAGSKEARELEKVKRNFEKAYKEAAKSGAKVEGTKHSISETTDGRIVAVVDSDILNKIDTTSWDKVKKEEAKKAASNALKKFKDGIVVEGIKRKVNKVSRKEYTRSQYTEGLYKKFPEVFADKMRAADIADDIVVATTNWNRDGYLRYPRNDNFVDFDHGTTLIACGDAKYSAEVVVGITAKGEAVFYDVVDMTPSDFEIKNVESPTTVTTLNAIDSINGDPTTQILPQNSEKSSGNTKHSLSAETENNYNEAVKHKDIETAQKIVDEVAKENGYTIKAYHGGDKFFTTFGKGNKTSQAPEGAHFFSSNKDVAYSYTTYKRDVNTDVNSYPVYEQLTREGTFEKNRVARGGVYSSFLKLENPYVVDFEGEYYSRKIDGRDINEIAEFARDNGYDGVIAKNIKDPGDMGDANWESKPSLAVADDYIVFNPNQIKSAEAITYDDNGNIIPLSERFKAENNDIRYSLSEGQEDYFKESKIRDESGNLKVMYHGSHETFTVFDKKKARSSGTYGKGFYFTDSKSHAGTYGDSYEVYLNIINPLQNGTNDITKDQLRKFVEAVAEDEDYGIENYGYGATIDSVTDSIYGKTDFGMILDLNVSCIGNMVEAVELFNKVNGTDYDGIVAPTETVAFYPNQIKSVTNENPTDNPDIRFSLSENVEETRDLMALHNLHSNELMKQFKMGGIAYPSVAVTKPETLSHEGFGDITLILNKDAIDPKKSKYNKLYSADAYTPTFPNVNYEASRDVAENIADKVKSLYDAIPEDYKRSLTAFRDYTNIDERLNSARGEEGLIERYLDDYSFKQLYLADKGEVVPTEIKRTETQITEYQREQYQFVVDRLGAELLESSKPMDSYTPPLTARLQWFEQYGDDLKDAYAEYWSDDGTMTKEEALEIANSESARYWARQIKAITDYIKTGGITVKEEADIPSTNALIDEKINVAEYKEWLTNLFSGIEGSSGIRNSKDLFTPSGKRRSFSQLHDPVTIDNVIKVMRKQGQTGQGAFGTGNIQGASAQEFGSIAVMKENSDRLGVMDEAEHEEITQQINDRIFEIAKRYSNGKDLMDAQTTIVEAVSKYETKEGIARYLKQFDYVYKYTDSIGDDIIELRDYIRSLPTPYFEAKPQRAVSFNEVAVFVIPRDADIKVKQELLNKGYSIAEYDPKIEGDRQRVVNSFEEYKFSLSDAGDTNFAPSDSWLVYGNRVTVPNDIAPVSTVSETEKVEGTVNEDDYAPMTEEQATAMYESDRGYINSFADADMPPEIDAPIYSADTSSVDEKSLKNISAIGRDILLLNAKERRTLENVVRKYSTSEDQSNTALFNEIKKLFGEKTYTERIEEVAEVRQALRRYKINVSPSIKRDIADYTRFMRRNFGKIIFSKEGLPVDTAYMELSTRYPEFFPSDIVNPSDQLQQMSEVANMEREITNTFEVDDDVIQEATDVIQEAVGSYKEKQMLKATEKDSRAILRDELSKEKKTANQRRVKQQQYRTQMEALVGDTSTWVDKKLGLSYEVNTLRRNLRDVVRDANGKKDIAKADAIYEELQGKYNHNEAELNREANRIKQQFAELKITKAEDTYIQMLGEFRHNPETTLSEDDVKDFYEKHKKHIDEAKVDKVIKDARTLYDDLLTRVNQVLSEQGMKEIPYRKGYFPHFNEEKQGILGKLFNWKTQNNEIPTSIAGLTEMFEPNRSWQSFNKQRKTDVTDYSFLKGLDTYVQGSLDWVYHIEDIQKRRALENHIRYTHSEEGIKEKINAIMNSEEYDADEMQDQIDLVYREANNPLNNFIQDFHTATNSLAGKKSTFDRDLEQRTNRKVYSVMTNLSNRVSGNMVAGSVSSALTNFIPITQSWVEVSPVNSLRAMGETIKSTIRDDGTVDKSDFLTNRLKKAENLYQTNWDKIGKGVGILMDVIDNFTAQTVWRSKYIQNMSKGMSESQAIKNADQFAANVMADRSRGNQPTLFDSKSPVAKVFTAFQLEVNNQYGYFFKDAPQDMADKSKARLIGGYATAFIGAYAYNALYSAMTGRDAAFDPIGIIEDLMRDLGFGGDDDEEEEIAPVDVALNLTNNILEEVPFIGGLLGGGRIPISSAMPYGGIMEAYEGTLKDISEKNLKSLTKEWLNPVYYLAMPMGGGQIRKTNQGLAMFSDDHPVAGSYTDSGNLRFPVEKTPGNVLQSAVFGQYANKNARTYFDEGYAPLKEKQIQEYKDADMPIADYWKYREGLKDFDKQDEKAAYINGLDISNKQKNVLKSYLYDEEGYKEENPEKYAFLEKEGIGYIGYKEADEDTQSAWSWAFKHQDEYEYYKENGVYPGDYSTYYIPMLDFEDDDNDAYSWAFNNPEKATFSKAITDNVVDYRKITSELYSIRADKDRNGKAINGTAKKKKKAYIWGLDIDEEAKYILFKNEYPSFDDKNREIVEYLINRDDLSYDEVNDICEQLGYKVNRDTGDISWD